MLWRASTLLRFPSALQGGGLDCSSLRTSNEHILIVRVPGARDRRGCHSTPPPHSFEMTFSLC
jgi:hypothetical protein